MCFKSFRCFIPGVLADLFLQTFLAALTFNAIVRFLQKHDVSKTLAEAVIVTFTITLGDSLAEWFVSQCHKSED